MNIKNSVLATITSGKPSFPKSFDLSDILRYAARMTLFSLLVSISFIYRGVVRLRVAAYRKRLLTSNSLPRPVISVGNITTGGTGKTPTVIAIATLLRQGGKRVAVLTRGYRRKSAAEHVIVTAKSTADEVGDEPLFIWKSLNRREPNAVEIPVIVGRRRYASGLLALDRFQPDIFLLDDGFQHLPLRRACDLALIDATNPFGGGYLLPAGLLREPVAHLSRASAFVITRSDEVTDCSQIVAALRQVNSDAPIFFGIHAYDSLHLLGQIAPVALAALHEKRLLAICGLGNPASFHRLIRGCGLPIETTLDFPDHHWYAEQDIHQINEKIRRHGIDAIITTEKDEPKLQQ